MNRIYKDIILDVIIERFDTEESFCESYLNISKEKWHSWKEDELNLSSEEMQKIQNLFTDYEWLLTQKVFRQTMLFPEKRHLAVSEYKRMKTFIAKKWLREGVANAELLNQEDMHSAYIDLKVTISYGQWGFDDIVTFRLPAVLQAQLENPKVELLDWVNENLMDAYVG